MNPTEIRSILKTTYPFLQGPDLEVLLERAEYRRFRNREVVIPAGQRSMRVFFILQGMVRGYFMNRDGAEINIFLRPEHTFTGSPDALFAGKPSKYTFESILESDLLLFNQAELLSLYADRPNLAWLYQAALVENIQTLIGRIEVLVDRSPEERYEELLARSPQFFQRAFHKHIANYLGITPVSLSRIIRRRKSAPDS